jgi:alginate O-acetyltransferase complex protein AlgI
MPLGGNRKGPARTHVNLLVVMLIGGFWHARVELPRVGGLHGVFLRSRRLGGKAALYRGLPIPLRVGITFTLVLISCVLQSRGSVGRHTIPGAIWPA